MGEITSLASVDVIGEAGSTDLNLYFDWDNSLTGFAHNPDPWLPGNAGSKLGEIVLSLLPSHEKRDSCCLDVPVYASGLAPELRRTVLNIKPLPGQGRLFSAIFRCDRWEPLVSAATLNHPHLETTTRLEIYPKFSSRSVVFAKAKLPFWTWTGFSFGQDSAFIFIQLRFFGQKGHAKTFLFRDRNCG